jgi:tetratricopeptide (TPR) repeat protein
VTHLLEGSVRTSGDQLRVTAQLVSGEDGFQLWSRVFDGHVNEVFQVQDQIAGLVVEALRKQLKGETVEALPAATATSMDAYRVYLLGRYELAQRTPESIRLAAGHFREAIELDPQYAPARSALAKTLVISPYYEMLAPPDELFPEAGKLARSAIALDGDNSEARSVLGTIAMIYERDWEKARIELLNSVQIHPNDAGNLNLYGDYLYNTGDYRQALEIEGRAAALDPLSASFQHELALVHAFLGEYGRAITLEQKAVSLNPEFSNAWNTLARLYLISGEESEFEALNSSGEARFNYPFRASLAVRRAIEDSEPVVALPSIEQLRRDADEGRVSPTVVAHLYAQSGDDLQAAYWVQRAETARDPILLSPLYFFLPEDWQELPVTRMALEAADLQELFDLRREHIASGNGRRQAFDLKF